MLLYAPISFTFKYYDTHIAAAVHIMLLSVHNYDTVFCFQAILKVWDQWKRKIITLNHLMMKMCKTIVRKKEMLLRVVSSNQLI
jgi:hypothetical protein